MDKVKNFVAEKVNSLPPALKRPYSGKQKLFGLFILLVLIGLGWMVYNQFKPVTVRKTAETLIVKGAYPYGVEESEYAQLTVNFNYQVDAHHMSEFVELTPDIKGEWKQGQSPTQVVFQPADRLGLGVSYKVLLKAGLTAANGKKLIEDYKYYFKVRGRGDLITFAKNDVEGKFMSFPQSSGADLKIKVGTDIRKPNVKIFKATSQDLLNGLVYKVETSNGYTNDYPGYGTYVESYTETSKMLPVAAYETVETDQVISLKEKVGLYLLQGFDGDVNVSNTWVTLNDSMIYFRQDDQKVVLGAQDIYTQVSTSGYQVKFVNLQDSQKQIGQYSLNDIQEYSFDGTKRLDLIVAQKGDDVMVVPVAIPNTQADVRPLSNLNDDKQLFLYTDRPIYKPGDTVFYRGLVRTDNDSLYKNVPTGTKVRVYVADYTNTTSEKIYDQTLTTNEGGVFAGQIKLTDQFKSGSIFLYATTSLSKDEYTQQTTASFDIADYIKPDFELTVDMEKGDYTKGDKIKATITGKYFNGQPLANQDVAYQLYNKDFYETEKAVYNKSFALNGWGGMCGAGGWNEYYGGLLGERQYIVLNAQGKAEVEFDTSKLTGDLSQEITLVASKDNQNYSKEARSSDNPYSANLNQIVSAKNAVVHAGEFNIFFFPGTNALVSGEQFNLGFYAENEKGEKLSNSEFDYAIIENNYNATSTQYDKTYLKQNKIQTNSDGVGRILDNFSPPLANNSYAVEVSKKDSRGNIIRSQKYVYFTEKNLVKNSGGYRASTTILKIVSSKANLTLGSQASLEIDAPENMTSLVSFDRGRVYKPQWLSLKKGKNTFTFNVEDSFAPSISPTFGFIYQGTYYIEGMSLNVPALHKLLTVNVFTDKLQYAPGDTALVTVETKDAAGNFVAADLSLGIVDKAIYALRKNSTPPIHSSFYFFRPRTTNDSSSLSLIGVYNNGGGGGGGGGGGDVFSKDVDTLYWNEKLRTGLDGRITIPVPVGNMETTWKILTYVSTEDTKVGQADFDMLVAK